MYHQIWSITSRILRWTSRKPYLTRNHFVKNSGPKAKSSQAGGATTSRYRRFIRNWRTVWPWFMWRMLKPRSLKCNSGILKDVTRDFTSTEIDLAKELEKDKHDRKKPLEAWRRLEEFGDVEDLLTFRRPNPCYIPTLDATFVSCHLFDVFLTATDKICLFKNYCLHCVYRSLSLLSHPQNPWTQ